MRTSLQILTVLGVLAAVGQLRMGFEQQLTEDLKRERIITPSFDIQSRASLSQKGFAASFGGMRPILAAITALDITTHHMKSDWQAIEESMETVVLLDPYNVYYWDLGGWHMAYNASSSTKEDADLPPLQRQRLHREWVEKGSSFFDRGIAANPQDLSLRLAKARLWSSPYRITDYAIVADTLEATLRDLELDEQQRRRVRVDLFYTLLRSPERLSEAYILGRALYDENPEARYPSLINGLCALQLHPRVKVENALTMSQLYGDRSIAKKHLSNYMRKHGGDKPTYGVQSLLDRL